MMQKKCKNSGEINKIKAVALLWKEIRKLFLSMLKPGSFPKQLVNAATELLKEKNAKFTFFKYQGFPGHICCSVNDVVIHGVPQDVPFKIGDKVSIDFGITMNEAICDAGFTYEITSTGYQLNTIGYHTQKALWAAIKIIKNGITVGDIAHTIEQYVLCNCPQYSIIDDFSGHGCGTTLHDEPYIRNKGLKPNEGSKLFTNMVICIEPILVDQPTGKYYIDKVDKWSVKLLNHGTSAHFEHMVLVTDNGCEVLTAETNEILKFL